MKINQLKRGLIVSCQAQPDEPLHGSIFMARMALAAEIGGAVGVRINTVEDILEVKKTVSIPVIGIIKKQYSNSPAYITPTLKEVDQVIEAGADIVAVDCTKSIKPDGKTAEEFIYDIKNKYSDTLLMADISTLEEGINAAKAGADIVATTLSGYTEYTKKDTDIPIEFQEPDFTLIEELVEKVNVPVIAEGRLWDSQKAVEAFKRGAFATVIGAGITRPQIITKRIVDNINEFLNK